MTPKRMVLKIKERKRDDTTKREEFEREMLG